MTSHRRGLVVAQLRLQHPNDVVAATRERTLRLLERPDGGERFEDRKASGSPPGSAR